ncbi:phospho-N-acetylmuramoyl-pentapeptide-transferase [Flavihumibacter sp. RY-1]|uniref:Phospho-N-acetylmuramoyl-pentapeptide-transferase n=1 Tax=Flavihumibacter fluminis TaxID=2909236 RepID=A0ABS9BK11_9BACT|nr:phospho-N-acetylmuramoyl-pentapeptide-transferase [Flavihumibacter fluminis]MCF1716052.1 phospho-N-acetylmuramoyl-pentapeptide-transferase [Flavihumibacter fluminis]
MLYHLIDWLKEMDIRIPGSALLQFITSRVLLAVILSLVITTVFGKKLINFLRNKQVGESVRDLGLAGEEQKKGTPTMGGLIIILAILLPTLLLADLNKAYVRLMIFSTIWLGIIGFVDDYLKLRAKRIAQKQGVAYKKGDKDGLAGWFKILGQVGLGLIIGLTLLFNDNTKVWREYKGVPGSNENVKVVKQQNTERYFVEANEPITTIPFVAGHEFNYAKLLPEAVRGFTSVLYVLIVIFIVTAVSNGANITDGIDGLATGVSAIIGVCLGVFAYASGNLLLADYLNIMYIPNLGELSIFIGAMTGACVGFLWYNAYPAQVFMGDTGSLTLGGIIAALAIIVRKELLIPIFCGVFLVENLSVMLQVSYFKYTKKKYGEGRRIFLMSPLHHHYQKLGYHESKIVTRFWIVTIFCVIFSIVTLKIR